MRFSDMSFTSQLLLWGAENAAELQGRRLALYYFLSRCPPGPTFCLLYSLLLCPLVTNKFCCPAVPPHPPSVSPPPPPVIGLISMPRLLPFIPRSFLRRPALLLLVATFHLICRRSRSHVPIMWKHSQPRGSGGWG